MENIRIMFFDNKLNSACMYKGNTGEYIDKIRATKAFLKTFKNEETRKNGMESICGLNGKYKFVIKGDSGDEIAIENVSKYDACFIELDKASTIKIKKHNELPKLVAISFLTISLTIAGVIGASKINDYVRERNASFEEYKADYSQIMHYYGLLKSNAISSSDLAIFEDLLNESLEKYNLSDEDEAFFKNCLREIESYNGLSSNIRIRF